MLSEQDLDDYMIWSGYAPQSRAAMRPNLSRGVRWLADMGVSRSPLRDPRDASCLLSIKGGCSARLSAIRPKRTLRRIRGRLRAGRPESANNRAGGPGDAGDDHVTRVI